MALSLVGTINVLQWILCACNEWNDDETLLKQISSLLLTLSCYKWDDSEALNKSVDAFMLLIQQQDNLRINYKIINKWLSNKNSMQRLIDELIPNRHLFIWFHIPEKRKRERAGERNLHDANLLENIYIDFI